MHRYDTENLVGLETAQGWNDFRPEEMNRAHQIFLVDGADVEFAQHGIEHAFPGGGLDLLDHGLRRADEGEIVLTKVVDIDRMTRDLGAAGIAAFGVVLRQSEITDPTVSSGAENPGETVFEVGFCFRHGLGVGLVNID